MGCHQTCPSLQELEICLVCVHTGGQDANIKAKEGALRRDNLFSKLITWKHRTEWISLELSHRLWDLEAKSQTQHGRAAGTVTSPEAWKQQRLEGWCWVVHGFFVGLQASVSLVCSCGRLRANRPCPSLSQLQDTEPRACCHRVQCRRSPGGATAPHSQFSLSVSKTHRLSKKSHM